MIFVETYKGFKISSFEYNELDNVETLYCFEDSCWAYNSVEAVKMEIEDLLDLRIIQQKTLKKWFKENLYYES